MGAVSERAIVFLIGAVQFVNILDFVMVMPLGPDFASSLGIPASEIGYIGGSYTAAAACAGLAGSMFLDRFDRRRALFVAILGLGVGTALGGLARDLSTLLVARVVAGAFGGPATSIAFAIIADVVPAERRGRAMGTVMGAFAVASVMGVPAGLELARLAGWRSVFFVVAALAILVAGAALRWLPPMRSHLDLPQAGAPSWVELLQRPSVIASYAMAFAVMFSGFIIIPNISAFVQGNLGVPRARIGSLYFFGGLVSFVSTRVGGQLVDRFGSMRVGSTGVAAFVVLNFVFFVDDIGMPVVVFFMSFMLAMGLRNVAYNTLTSKVPLPEERARFMSILSAVQHTAAACGAFLSARLLTSDGVLLTGMPRVTFIAIGFSLAVPPLLHLVEKSSTLRRA